MVYARWLVAVVRRAQDGLTYKPQSFVTFPAPLSSRWRVVGVAVRGVVGDVR